MRDKGLKYYIIIIRNWLRQWFHFEYYAQNLGFIFFLTALALVYIWNRHQAESKTLKINKLQQELTEVNWQYTTLKSELNQKSMESEVIKKVKPLGLHVLTSPPEIIIEHAK